jgi:hypothetical protein
MRERVWLSRRSISSGLKAGSLENHQGLKTFKTWEAAGHKTWEAAGQQTVISGNTP